MHRRLLNDTSTESGQIVKGNDEIKNGVPGRELSVSGDTVILNWWTIILFIIIIAHGSSNGNAHWHHGIKHQDHDDNHDYYVRNKL